MIAIWKFDEAPPELRKSVPVAGATWVMRAPAYLAAELETILDLNGLERSVQHEESNGTVIFWGCSKKMPTRLSVELPEPERETV